MGRILIVLISAVLTTACVTEKTFVDSKKQVRSFEFDRTEAARTRLILGLSYLENNKYEQAKFNLEKALEFAPTRADVNYSLGYYYQMVGEMDIAETYYLKAIDFEPNNPDTHNNYGTFLCNVGQLDKAAGYFKKAISISKYTRAADSYENLAICALSNDEILQAQEYFELSYKHNPGRPNNLLSLAGIKYATGDIVAALDFYSRYMRISQPGPRALLLGYILEEKRGRLTQANKYLDQLVQTFPNSREALYATSKTIINSEFEQLRLKYQSKRNSPQIRITRKTATSNENQPSRATQSTSLVKKEQQVDDTERQLRNQNLRENQRTSGGLVLPATVATAVSEYASKAEFVQDVKDKVEMFSKPLTDTEKAKIPELIQSTVAIEKEQPLPEEKVLVSPIKNAVLVNDRASTQNNRVYLQPSPQGLIAPTYKIQKGDNLYRISLKFNIKVSTLAKWNGLNDKDMVVGHTIYVAQPEPYMTLNADKMVSDVAREEGVSLQTLLRWNNLEQDGWLKEGTEILMSDPDLYTTKEQQAKYQNLGEPLTVTLRDVNIPTHTVKAGEFLYKISSRYNVKLETLMKWNNLTQKSKLQIGQSLFVADPDIYFTVPKLQSISEVASNLDVDVAELKRWNQIDRDGVVTAGTKLLKVNPEQY